MFAQGFAASAGFDADQFDFLVLDEIVKDPDGIRSPAHTSDDRFGKLAFGLENLCPRFLPDHAVEVAHHGRIRMRPQYAAEQVVRGADVRDPVTHGLVDGVFQGA